jgi:hypothetical protein
MPDYVKVCWVAVLLAAMSACESRRSATGFRLPDDGDPEKGKLAFVQFQCYTCHDVPGEDLPN